MKVQVSGGMRLEKILHHLKSAKAVSLSYGYYPKSTYPDGTPVAQVAFWNEYGTDTIPERPFFRLANQQLPNKLSVCFSGTALAKGQGIVCDNKLSLVGEIAVNTLQESIKMGVRHYVPNAPATIRAKKSTKPLVDTGRLFMAPSYQVNGA